MILLKNLIKLSQSKLVRFSSSSLNDTMPTYFRERESHLIKLLNNHGFNDKQKDNIRNFIVENHIQLTDQDLFQINSSVIFWKNNVEDWPKIHGETLLDHLHVLSTIEPRLLFIELAAMRKILNLVQNSGFVDSKHDISRLFIDAPKAVFLQNWQDVILKANYLHHRVVDWITMKKNISLYPHPIVKYPKVLELPYDDIKTRFLFAVNSGYRAKGLYQNLSKSTHYDVFRDLLTTDFQSYLSKVCNGLTEEEYLVYKEMIKIQLQEEDQIFSDLSKMNDSIASIDQEMPKFDGMSRNWRL